jgi:hypothetical protein
MHHAWASLLIGGSIEILYGGFHFLARFANPCLAMHDWRLADHLGLDFDRRRLLSPIAQWNDCSIAPIGRSRISLIAQIMKYPAWILRASART